MEPITLTAIGIFLAPYLIKAGDKVTEKTVEALFDSRKDLAEKFKGLFNTEIISLGLSDTSSSIEISKQLEAKPEIKEEISKKVANNQDLLNELIIHSNLSANPALKGIAINAEKIAQVNINSTVTQNISNF